MELGLSAHRSASALKEQRKLPMLLGLGIALLLTLLLVPFLASASSLHDPPAFNSPLPGLLKPSFQAGGGSAGTSATFLLTVQNQTTSANSFLVSPMPGGNWSTTLSITQTNVLPVGGEQSFTASVSIPPSAGPGDQDTVSIEAISANMPTASDIADVRTLVICELNRSTNGSSPVTLSPLDNIYDLQGQPFTYAYVYVFSGDDDTLDGTVSGYNPGTANWEVIAQQVGGGSGLLADQLLLPPTYSQIRIQLVDTEGNDLIYYDYSLVVCREPRIDLSPQLASRYGAAGTIVQQELELTNWMLADDSFTLAASGNGWPVSLSIVQTPILSDGESIAFTVAITVPPGAAAGSVDQVSIQATSISSPTVVSNQAVISTTAVSQNLAYATFSGSNQVVLLDVDSQLVLEHIDVGAAGCRFPWRATLSPDQQRVYVGCYNSGSVAVIGTDDNTVLHNIAGIRAADDISFSRDGTRALVGSRSAHQLMAIDTASLAVIGTLSTPDHTRSLASHPFLDLIYATSGNGSILVVDPLALQILAQIPVGGEPWDVAVSPDGHWVFSGDRWGGLKVIDASNNTLYSTITGHNEITGLAVTADGSTLYAAALDRGIYVFDAQAFTYLSTVSDVGTVWEVALTCKGESLLVGNLSNRVPIVDTATNTIIGMPATQATTSRGIAACPERATAGIYASPRQQAKQGGRGEVVTYQVNLFNRTGMADTFLLEMGSHLWATSLSGTSVGPIPNLGHATYSVSVTVPINAPWYLTDTVAITATSSASPTAFSATALLITEAYAPPVISLSPQSLASTQYAGAVTHQFLNIGNGPGIPLDFEIAASGRLLSSEQDHTIPGVQHVAFTATHDIYDYVWGDGGNDAFDGFGYPTVRVGGVYQMLYMTEGERSYTIDNYPVVVRNHFPEPNAYRMVIEPGPGALERPDIFVGLSGNMGSNGSTVTEERSFQYGGQTIRYFVNNDYGGNLSGDPQVVFLLLPSQPEDLANVAYRNSSDQVSFDVADATLPVTVYIVVSYHDLSDIEQWFQDDLLPGVEVGPWLTTSPMSGTVPTSTSVPVDVAFDSTAIQPGHYNTTLFVHSTDPVTPTASVPVSMTVLPTADMGRVVGSLADAWTGQPLAGRVELQGVYAMTADPDYQIWAPAGSYSMTVTSPGYFTETQQVDIVAGAVLTRDLALEPAQPRIEWSPASLMVSIASGSAFSETLMISNTGPMPLSVQLFEVDPVYTARKPALEDLNTRRILFDVAHGEPSTGNYSILIGDLANAGAQVDVNYTYPITPGTLAGYDVLWVNCCGNRLWTFSELSAVNEWLRTGGALFVQGPYSIATAAPASIYDILYHDGPCLAGPTTQIMHHPITAGVGTVTLAGSCDYLSHSGSGQVVVLNTQGNPHVIAETRGAGKMVVAAGLELTNGNISSPDNRLLGNNILAWLARPAYSDVSWLFPSPQSLVLPGHSAASIDVGLDATSLAEGSYEALLVVEHDDPALLYPVELPITLTVERPVAVTLSELTATTTPSRLPANLLATVVAFALVLGAVLARRHAH